MSDTQILQSKDTQKRIYFFGIWVSYLQYSCSKTQHNSTHRMATDSPNMIKIHKNQAIHMTYYLLYCKDFFHWWYLRAEDIHCILPCLPSHTQDNILNHGTDWTSPSKPKGLPKPTNQQPDSYEQKLWGIYVRRAKRSSLVQTWGMINTKEGKPSTKKI